MRLPGTRYQEHGWEHVRKMLGRSSLLAFAHLDPAGLPDALPLYVDLVAENLQDIDAPGNSYGDSVQELALTLVYELLARPADWQAFCAAVAGEHAKLGPFWQQAGGEAILRKKFNDMYAVLRDKVDSDNYQAACGRPCSPNRMYAYRMLDTAYGEVARIFSGWQEHSGQVSAILGRDVSAIPIEVRQMKSIGHCKAEWIMRWSESLERFGGAPGPLHTRSKRFDNLKDNPAKIADMLAEIGDYEELSANRDQDWLLDADAAADWMDDLHRVLAEAGAGEDEPEAAVSPPPRLVLAEETLPVRLAVYLKMLGGADDSYPDEWRDPATGELPTMAQLAARDNISLPTLRKRRDAAIDRLSRRTM